MKIKILLLIILIWGACWTLYPEKVPAGDQTTVYYFYWNPRCYSCNKIEELSKSVVSERFKDAVKKGSLMWKAVNVKEKKNAHFLKKYGLYTKSVVVVRNKNGKEQSSKVLSKVWELLNKPDAFKQYVYDQIQSALKH